MKGKLEPSERQRLIEEGAFGANFHTNETLSKFLKSVTFLYAGKNLKEGLTALEEDLVKLNDKLQQEAQCIPNMTHPDVPIGGEDRSTIRNMVFQLLQFPSFFSYGGKRLVLILFVLLFLFLNY